MKEFLMDFVYEVTRDMQEACQTEEQREELFELQETIFEMAAEGEFAEELKAFEQAYFQRNTDRRHKKIPAAAGRKEI